MGMNITAHTLPDAPALCRQMLGMLLHSGKVTNVDVPNRDGETPLFGAVIESHVVTTQAPARPSPPPSAARRARRGAAAGPACAARQSHRHHRRHHHRQHHRWHHRQRGASRGALRGSPRRVCRAAPKPRPTSVWIESLQIKTPE